MKKEIYLIGGTGTETYPEFHKRILAAAEAAIVEYSPEKLWLTLTMEPPPRLSVIPFRRQKTAAISVIRKDEETTKMELLTQLSGFRSATTVEEAIPVSYSKSWKNGTLTPGICLLTLFRQKQGLPRETFLDRWHNSHTPLSLRIHPLWHYNRNVVTVRFGAAEPAWDGIVEEHFRTRADLLNPFLFFGNPLVIIQHMMEVYRDTNSFLDYKTIEPYLVREYHLKS